MTESAAAESTWEGEILIFAPTGQDSSLLSKALQSESLTPVIFKSMDLLCPRLRQAEAGALLVAEEALSPEALKLLNEALSLQPAWSDIPIIVMTSGGATTASSLRVLRAFTPSGNVTLLERPFRAITLLSTLQVALRARRRQYQVRELLELQIQATRIRDEFISIASHELKTPLTSLKLQTQLNQKLIKTQNPLAFSPERIIKLIDTTGSQVDRLSKLVEDMLDISRIHAGKLHLNRTSFDLRELVQELVDRFLPQFHAANCTLTIEAPGPVHGEWDRYRLEQVVNNLLTNAIRYSPGTPIHVSVQDVGEKARLAVRDQGAGIAPENLDRIFQRFERAVSSGNISGLGLGLYICRQITEAHEGLIRVESEVGQGSVFVVELPLRERSAS